jgi:hypothetical protein
MHLAEINKLRKLQKFKDIAGRSPLGSRLRTFGQGHFSGPALDHF